MWPPQNYKVCSKITCTELVCERCAIYRGKNSTSLESLFFSVSIERTRYVIGKIVVELLQFEWEVFENRLQTTRVLRKTCVCGWYATYRTFGYIVEKLVHFHVDRVLVQRNRWNSCRTTDECVKHPPNGVMIGMCWQYVSPWQQRQSNGLLCSIVFDVAWRLWRCSMKWMACMEMLCSLNEQFFGGTVNLKKAASWPFSIWKPWKEMFLGNTDQY